jgi:hypothetical protein
MNCRSIIIYAALLIEPQKKAVRHFLVHERLLNLAVVGR